MAELEAERRKSEELLLNVLPASIARRLRDQPGVVADSYLNASVLFADIVGFTPLSELTDPVAIVALLNQIFSAFDNLVEQHGLEKIKTIGDAYMVAGGVPEESPGHLLRMGSLALEMLDEIQNHKAPDGGVIHLRIGINTGPVVAGVIGRKKFIFDLWGDTVNIAARMESHGLPGTIHVTSRVFVEMRDRFQFEKRGILHVKGRGEMMTYFLVGHRPEESPQEILERTREFGEARQGMTRARAEIGSLSLTDELTGLRSRQGFAAVVEHLFSVAGREKRRVLLALLRLDNLENIYLEFGHEVGETALRLIAQVLLQTFRTSDLCARVGDRIFLIAGPEVTPAPADILVRRFEMAIHGHIAATPPDYPLLLSGHGVAWDHTTPRTLDELLTELELGLRTLDV